MADEVPENQADAQKTPSPLVPSHNPLPQPPEVTYTRPSLGRGTSSSSRDQPGTHNLGSDRPSGPRTSGDPHLLAQGARGYGVAITAALTLAITLGVFILIGQYLDHRYHPSGTPWFTIVGVFLGIAGGFTTMIRMLTNAQSGGPRNDADKK